MSDELSDFNAQLARLKKAAGVKTDTALAHLLDITQGGFSGAKRRARVPHKWFVFVSTNYGVSLEWLLSGGGSPLAGQEEDTRRENAALKARVAELEAQLRERESTISALSKVVNAALAGNTFDAKLSG